MLIKNKPMNRRRVLRGVLGGGAVAVSLPFFDCFLNSNGTALAATNAPLPTRFGTWFWGLGMNGPVFIPKKVGADFDLPEEIAPLKDVKQHINLFTNFSIPTDGRANLCHYSGWVALRCGSTPRERNDLANESLDLPISRAIGAGSRFRLLNLSATGNPRDSYSFQAATRLIPRKYLRWMHTAKFSVPIFRIPILRPLRRILVCSFGKRAFVCLRRTKNIK